MDGKIPVLAKMSLHVNDWRSYHLQRNVLPRHSWLIFSIQITCAKFSWFSDSSQSLIVVISPIPKVVFVINWMLLIVPSAITNVKASHETDFFVNDDAFLMMRPQLRYENAWMPQNFEVFAHVFKHAPDIKRVIA